MAPIFCEFSPTHSQSRPQRCGNSTQRNDFLGMRCRWGANADFILVQGRQPLCYLPRNVLPELQSQHGRNSPGRLSLEPSFYSSSIQLISSRNCKVWRLTESAKFNLGNVGVAMLSPLPPSPTQPRWKDINYLPRWHLRNDGSGVGSADADCLSISFSSIMMLEHPNPLLASLFICWRQSFPLIESREEDGMRMVKENGRREEC